MPVDLSLWWVLPARQKKALGRRVLQALSVVPEARPRRFGIYEPVRQELAPDDDEPFLALWRDEAAKGGSLLWKGSKSFRGGSVDFPSETTWELGLAGQETIVSLRIEVRPSGYTEPERRKALVAFFAKVADKLGAVYASAGLSDQVQPEAGVSPLVGHLGTVVFENAWIGLPPFRTWLHWFGSPYLPELADLPGVVKSGRGLLLSRGEQPGVRGELSGPPIPGHLCWRGRTPEEERAYGAELGAFFAQLDAAEARGEPPPPRPLFVKGTQVAAEVIPEFGGRRLEPRSAAPTPTAPKAPNPADTPSLLWKDEDGPGWPGGVHPDRVGPAWVERPDGSIEELNDGAWINRAEAERLAAEKNYVFEEV